MTDLIEKLRPHPRVSDDASVMYRAKDIRALFDALAAQAAEIERLTKERDEYIVKYGNLSFAHKGTLARADALAARVTELEAALRMCAEAADEFYRYQYGGETRGSYDGKPERQRVFDAGRKARAAIRAKLEGK